MHRQVRSAPSNTSARFTIRRRGREVERVYKKVNRHISW